MAKKILGIKIEEQEAAAKYFTMSNMALLDIIPPHCKGNINRAYDYVDGVVQSETPSSCNPEFKSWLKECKKAKPEDYVAKEWKIKRLEWGFKDEQ